MDGDGLKPNDRVLIRRRRGDTRTQEKPHGDAGRDGREAATSPGMDAWSPQKLEEAGRTLPWSLCRDLSPGTP